MSVSTATRLRGSWLSIASRIESLIWSAILSGWPSVTDSDVKRRRATGFSLRRRTGSDGPRTPSPDEVALEKNVTGGGVPCVRPAAARSRRGGHPAGHRGPDPRGDDVLAAAGHLGDPAVGAQDDGGVVRPAEHLPGRDVVDHEEVAALAGELDAGVGEHVAVLVPGLGGEADDQLPRRPLGDQLDEHIGV